MCSNKNEKNRSIKKIVRLLGVPTNILGYTYICQSLDLMVENPRMMFLKEVYRLVAKNNVTSSEAVEVSIRNAVKKVIEAETEEFIKIFGKNVKSLSNSKFLTLVKELLCENF